MSDFTSSKQPDRLKASGFSLKNVQKSILSFGRVDSNESINLDILAQFPLGIACLDARGSVTYSNSKLFAIFGIAEEDRGSDAEQKLQDLPRLKVPGHNRTVWQSLNKDGVIQIHEVEFLTLAGSKRWMGIYGAVQKDINGKLISAVLMCADATAYVDLRSQFLQAQKMEAVGQLAGGVAHDFNNLLTIVNGNLEMLQLKLGPDATLQNYISEALKASDKARDLTRQLMTFSRKNKVETAIVNVNKVIQDMDRMLRRIIRENIKLSSVSDSKIGAVEINPGQIEQVIMNLVVNARDAMPDGGELTIETADVELDEEYAQSHANVEPGRYIMIAVSDNGCGMTEEVRSKVFDPFFTTKGANEGTGLGLSTVYGIVKQAKGHIWVYSEPGEGTTFKVYLPSVNIRARDKERTERYAQIPRGTETVLIVEDDKSVREMTVKILSKFGYNILSASTANEAVDICLKNPGQIELLLTDVVLTDESGIALADRLREFFPDLKVMVMSGYTANALMRQGFIEKDFAFLQKPFSIQTLTTQVRKILDNQLSLN